jgi:hypothetical protein
LPRQAARAEVTAVEHRSRVVRLDDAYEDPERVWRLVTDGGPYTLMMSLAGYDMSTGDHAAMPWFRKYWAMNRELLVADSEPLFRSPRFLDTARDVTGTDHVLPYQLMVNLMGPMDTGAAHLDTPTFRSEPVPLWLRLEMGASELFERWRVPVCGAVSWFLYDGPGGEYEYWPDGTDAPSACEAPPFGNVAVFGDNDRMFHRVGAIGTLADRLAPGSLSGAGTLHAVADGRWEIRDRSAVLSLDAHRLRVSILWTAMCFETADDHRKFRDHDDVLTLERVTEIFAHDLRARGERFDLPTDPAGDPDWVRRLEEVYPLPTFTGPAYARSSST